MSEPVIELGDRMNWDLAGRFNLTARLIDGGDKFIPIPPVSTVAPSNIIAAGGSSAEAPAHWTLAAWISPSLLVSPSSTSNLVSVMSLPRYAVPLNRFAFIHFPKYEPQPYLCYITIPPWLKQLSLEVWYYSGPQSTLEDDALARIEAKVDTLQ